MIGQYLLNSNKITMVSILHFFFATLWCVCVRESAVMVLNLMVVSSKLPTIKSPPCIGSIFIPHTTPHHSSESELLLIIL